MRIDKWLREWSRECARKREKKIEKKNKREIEWKAESEIERDEMCKGLQERERGIKRGRECVIYGENEREQRGKERGSISTYHIL